MGVTSQCKPCRAELRKPGLAAARQKKVELASGGMKRCGACGETKPIAEYHTRRSSKDGLAYKCAVCVIEYGKRWKEKNPDAFKNWYAEHKDDRAGYWQDWYEANKDQRAVSYAEWAKRNRHVTNALVAKRNAKKFKATPPWADMDAIRAFYAEAARLTKETGIRHEVDHIYPLQGELVCGLHCEANLQILTKTENTRKKNRMPEELGYA